MGLSLTGWWRGAGVVFAILIPALLTLGSQPQWGIYQTITAERAGRIEAAIEGFHNRSGAYPAALQDTVPRDMLWVQDPVIFRGYGWCYQGNDQGYRLGAVYREFFSTPISIKIYATEGLAAFDSWTCDQQVKELKARYLLPGEVGWKPTND